MEIIENSKVKEKIYIDKAENGLTIMVIPKENFQKKYVIFGTHYGSLDNEFIMPITEEHVKIPDGVAHFLEHKMFEQENGTNSLDVLSALGVEANAYTTNDHTAYLFEATEKFYEALDELMDYVQKPYFTYDNVEKEKGIIGQEIRMYDDHPGWQAYMNAMKCMYKNNPIKIDIAGTVESISKIDKDVLYKCYNTFYHPSNMSIVLCGDFVPEDIIKEVKKRLINKGTQTEIKRIYPEESEEISNNEITSNMDVSNPLFAIGIKDVKPDTKNIVKKHIAIQILLELIIGESSSLYQELYNQGKILSVPNLDYEFSNQYAHILITGQSREPKYIYEQINNQIEKMKEEGIDHEEFDRIKKKIYGGYITEYNSISNIARNVLEDYFKGINGFDYIEQYPLISTEYVQQILKDVFKKEKMVLSIVEGK